MSEEVENEAVDPGAVRILVVDDLASLRKVILKQLRGVGFENLDEAEDGKTAWEKLEQQEFQLVISDWEMPNMSGIELLQQMKSSDAHKAIPFLMVTSVTDKELVVVAIKTGAADYICKPFKGELLLEKVYKLTGAQTAESVSRPSSE